MRTLALLLLALAAACSAASAPPELAVTALTFTPDSGKARIYVFRPDRLFGSAAYLPVGVPRRGATRDRRAPTRTPSGIVNGSIRSRIASVITNRTDTSDQPASGSRRHAPGAEHGRVAKPDVTFQSRVTASGNAPQTPRWRLRDHRDVFRAR